MKSIDDCTTFLLPATDRRAVLRFAAALLSICVLMCPVTGEGKAAAGLAQENFSEAELDEMLSPIALYPDPLLAQMIPAATFLDQLQEAQQVLGGNTDDDLIAKQNWDVSVKSIAHYPEILYTMLQQPDWTASIGQAYVNQPNDVAASIQRLRAQAQDAGTLTSTPQQEVTSDNGAIQIEPAQPQYIYVPYYSPQAVYGGGAVVASAISFGTGLAIGAWLNNDWDWHGRGIYYHGWNGGGWIGANRDHVNLNRTAYINNNLNRVNVNRNITNHNNGYYRTNLSRNAAVRQENFPATNLSRTSHNDALINRAANSHQLDSFRGREVQNGGNRPEPNSAFGGRGNSIDARRERERGSNSLDRMRMDNGPGNLGRDRGVERGNAGVQRPAGGGVQRPAGGTAQPRPAGGGNAPRRGRRG